MPPAPCRAAAARGRGTERRLRREPSRGDDALTPALALDAHDPALEIEIAGPQAGELRDAQPAAVQQLQRRPVAQAERRGVRVLDEQLGLLGRQNARQALRQPRQRDERAGVQGARPDAAAVAQQRARSSQAPPARRGRQAGSLERAGERLEVVGRGVVDLDVALAQEVAQLREVAAVGGHRVPGGAALERHVREELCDRIHAGRFARRRRYPPAMALHEHARRGSRTEPVDCVVWLDGEPARDPGLPGVHTPSPLTQALMPALPRVDGLEVIDAGCGAGAVTVALLRRGAAHVAPGTSSPRRWRTRSRMPAATPIRPA